MNTLGASNYESARKRLRTVLISAAVTATASVLTPAAYSQFKLAVTFATLLLFAAVIVVIVRDCRCPHCGKIIFLGALSATHCPRCKRGLTSGKKQKKSR